MTIQSDVAGLVGHWRTTTAGYNTEDEKLTDASGFGNHLFLESGTPDFTQSAGGYTGFKMHGDSVFIAKDTTGAPVGLLPQAFTWVMAVHTNLNAGNIFYPFYATKRAYAATDDPEWSTPTDSLSANFGTSLHLRLLGTACRWGDATYKLVTGSFTTNQVNIFTLVLEPVNGLRKIIVNDGTPVTATGPTQQRHMLFNDELRIGYSASPPITTASGESMTSFQHMLFAGDVTADPKYDTMITALMADPTS